MLVLTRKQTEQITIGQDITITIVRLKGNTVRIGIEAPDHVRIRRGEIPEFDTDGNLVVSMEPQPIAVPHGAPIRSGTPGAPGATEARASHIRGPSAGLKPRMMRLGHRRAPETSAASSQLVMAK